MEPLRIANCSGFYGDRRAAPRELLEGGPIDVLTGDYLAELTMLILWRSRGRDPAKGYATSFLAQMEECLGLAVDKGVKVVANAGGLNPAGLAAELRALAGRLGLTVSVAHVEGDDLLGRLDELKAAGEPLAHLDTGTRLAEAGVTPVTANAYLGAWGIVAALEAGADVVVSGRVTDASLVVGPAAWHFGWAADDWDRLAGAVVAGHVLECGTQATGGNYAFLDELPDTRPPGFPIAEVAADGSAVVTKHPGTGGLVSVGTVTAQLLYEIAGPAYEGPDVVARFDTVRVTEVGPDRVRLSGTRGEPAPDRLKVAINYLGGFRNSMSFVLTGLDLEAKAAMAETALFDRLGGREQFQSADTLLVGHPTPDPPTRRGVRRRAPHHRQGPRPLQGRPRLLLRRHRADPGQLPRLLHHHPTHRRHPLRHLLASPGSRRPGRPDSRPRRRPPPGHQAAHQVRPPDPPWDAPTHPVPRRVPRTPADRVDPPPRCRSGGCSGHGRETREGTRTSGSGPGTSAPTASSSGS